jgi:shikimate dehydrogenase
VKSSSAFRLGIIGWPVRHSLSPTMHNAAFASLGLAWQYELWPTPADQLSQRVDTLRTSNYRGANVTVPHKEAVLPLLDRLDPAAAAIGAVNTVVVDGGQLVGHNTDGEGFLAALRRAGFRPEGCRVLLLGAGGAARAVAYSLLRAGTVTLTIANRDLKRATLLAEQAALWSHSADLQSVPLTFASIAPYVANTDLLINATSVGMDPDIASCPWPGGLALPSQLTVFDLVYRPRGTRLLQLAVASQCRIVDGLEMLVQQGAEALRLWTGREPPIALMRQACAAALPHDPLMPATVSP